MADTAVLPLISTANYNPLKVGITAAIGVSAVAAFAIAILAANRVIAVHSSMIPIGLVVGGTLCSIITVGSSTYTVASWDRTHPAARRVAKLLDSLEQYYDKTNLIHLFEIKKQLMSAPRRHSDCLFAIERTGKHHLFHDHFVKAIGHKNSASVWANIVRELHDQNIEYPDGRRIKLNMMSEQAHLQNQPLKFRIEKLDTANLANQDVQEINTLFHETFVKGELPESTKAYMEQTEFEQYRWKNHLYVAKLESSTLPPSIIGMVFVKEHENPPPGRHKFHIAVVARSPHAAQMGVANQILTKVFQELIQHNPSSLEVRKTNDEAKKLYKKFGFSFVSESKTDIRHFPIEPVQHWATQPLANHS